MRAGACLLSLLLVGCTAVEPHAPPFARVPFQPFSAETVAAVATREWRLFGGRDFDPDDATSPERDNGLWQRVGEYWWMGLDPGARESGWTGRHDGAGWEFPADRDGEFAWSAAFISYVMRIAGAGGRFPYAPDHAEYINAARRGGAWVMVAERPETYAPQPGDLVCRARSRATGMRFDDLPAPRFPSHCDIVIGPPSDGVLPVVGGNVGDSVTRRLFPVAPDGRLLPAEPPWLAVLRVEPNGPAPVQVALRSAGP